MSLLQGNLEYILIATISMSIPLILASLGGVFSARSGIMALGLESMMMTGAFSAVAGSYATGSALWGVLIGMLGGALFAFLYGILCIRYKVNQVIAGVGMNLLALAATTLLTELIWGSKGSSPQVASISVELDFLKGIPLIGNIIGSQSILFLFMVIFIIVGWIILFKTVFGMRLRVVGENPKAASTMGLKVKQIKYTGVLICGVLAGLAGAYLSIDNINLFQKNMTAGRGYIAVVIAILGRYNPFYIVFSALIFGFSDALQIYLQGQGVPSQIMQTIPYFVTLFVLAFGVKHIRPPAGIGKHEDEH
ncbi:ABC transporter permease [Vallitalea sp.]|jgi:simple sugar transport system permease protein|uniref:ABC transporter permease n=1 Tax=Vallitalea sp. TaxID=1882829 RepID=UPI0025CF32D7|nr:ABC transporter permease [Vallitalea sp.]MCT4686134.1 ABC transporter permease [Vallitalea sp.]